MNRKREIDARPRVLGICEVCEEKPATQEHHLLSQTKLYKKLYGPLIHHPRNKLLTCEDCHMTKPMPKFTEREFCDALGIAPRSKTLTGSSYVRR